MSDAADILQRARERGERRDAYEREHRIDYALMNKLFPKQKAALTRALNKTDLTERRDAVVLACEKVIQEWETVGAWPDEWSRWQRALDDVIPFHERIDLGDLR